MDDRLIKACEGKSATQGGINVPELHKMAVSKGYTGKKIRKEILEFLCKPQKATLAPKAPKAPKKQSKPGLAPKAPASNAKPKPIKPVKPQKPAPPVKKPAPGLLIDSMTQIVNMQPGDKVKFLDTYDIYFVDLRKTDRNLANIIDNPGPGYKFIDGINETCRWSITDKYFKETVEQCDYAMIAVVMDDADPRFKYYGAKAFAFIKADAPSDPKGCYLKLVCNAGIWTENAGDVKLRLGHLMFLGLLNYAQKHLGKQHVYNHASNLGLIPYYGRNGWVPSDVACGESDYGDGFPSELDKMSPYVQELEKQGKIKPTSHGYKMKLCDPVFQVMFEDLLQHTTHVLANVPVEDYKQFKAFA